MRPPTGALGFYFASLLLLVGLMLTGITSACGDDTAVTPPDRTVPDAGGGTDTGGTTDDMGGGTTDTGIGVDTNITVDTGSVDTGPRDVGTGNIGDFSSCVMISTAEVCDNGFDDDCDGLVDEACGCAPEGDSKTCYPGSAMELTHPSTGCRAGTQMCSLEFWSACTGAIGPQTEACDDEVDNDCDGMVDEGCEEPGPPTVTCTADFMDEVLNNYTLVGTATDPEGLEITSQMWSLVSEPAGHSRLITFNQNEVTFFADVTGQYVWRFTALNSEGLSATCDTTFTAFSNELIRIELFWNQGVADDASDVDLHLHRNATGEYYYLPENLNDPNLDNCFWDNCATCPLGYTVADRENECRRLLAGANPPGPVLTWGEMGIQDDPRLDLDDDHGNGPEVLSLDRPQDGTYRVAVHYYDPHGAGAASVSLRILCGELELNEGPVSLQGGADPENGDLWEVGDLTVTNAGTACTYQRLADTGCYQLCPMSDFRVSGCSDVCR